MRDNAPLSGNPGRQIAFETVTISHYRQPSGIGAPLPRFFQVVGHFYLASIARQKGRSKARTWLAKQYRDAVRLSQEQIWAYFTSVHSDPMQSIAGLVPSKAVSIRTRRTDRINFEQFLHLLTWLG